MSYGKSLKQDALARGIAPMADGLQVALQGDVIFNTASLSSVSHSRRMFHSRLTYNGCYRRAA